MGEAARTGTAHDEGLPTRPGLTTHAPQGPPRSDWTGAETLSEEAEPDEAPALQFERGATIDRYTVLDRIGAGAMGVVYTAYDPRLDRRVALKLMHARPGPRGAEIVARLLREAQALARLQHPNVVAIYDANAIGDLVYLTMELVDGSNLSRWLKETRRSSQAILDTFIEAGRGLAAAHKAGIVHRDFKPDNVLVGRDGRVRVVDFGIARGADGPEFTAVAAGMSENISTPEQRVEDSKPASPYGSTDRGEVVKPRPVGLADTDPAAAREQAAALGTQGLESAIVGLSSLRLTRTGALVGTPAYMAPEQHMGVRVDARADQFAFCVALFEALFGAHPFPAKNYMQLTTSVLGGKIDSSSVRTATAPPHVRRAILRGLAVDPAQRFETMDDLLAALVPAERRRRTLGGAFALAGLAAVITGGVVWAQMGGPVCEGAERRLVGVWDDDVRESARKAFLATGQPYASRAAETASAVLDEYATAWATMRREVCEASLVHHEQSPMLLDRRVACLDRHLDQLQATTLLFREADREVVQRAAAIVGGLPDLKECADADRLMRGERRSLAERDEIAKLEGMLAHAVAQRHAARYASAQALVERALHKARTLRATAVEAEALILLGQIAADQGRFDQAAESHAHAIAAAELGGVDEARALATAELGVVLGALQHRHDEGERLLRLAEAIDLRVRAGPIQQARRDMFLGIVLGERGDLDDARQKLLKAVEALKAAPASARLMLVSAYNALGSLEDQSGRPEQARAYYGDALALAEDRLGADHPDVATVLNNIGVLEKGEGRYDAAIAAHERALAIRVRTLGPDHPEIASARMNLGIAFQHAGEIERAIAHFEATAAALRRAPELQRPLAETLYNLALCHFQRDDFARAVPIFEEALSRAQAVGGPEDQVAASALQGLAVALVELGRLEEAWPLLDRALRIQTARGIQPFDLAEIRFALARVLVRRDRPRALELASAARGDFARGGETELVARVDAWLQAHIQR